MPHIPHLISQAYFMPHPRSPPPPPAPCPPSAQVFCPTQVLLSISCPIGPSNVIHAPRPMPHQTSMSSAKRKIHAPPRHTQPGPRPFCRSVHGASCIAGAGRMQRGVQRGSHGVATKQVKQCEARKQLGNRTAKGGQMRLRNRFIQQGTGWSRLYGQGMVDRCGD